MLLRSGNAKLDVLSLLESLLSKAGSLPQLINWSKDDFIKMEGIGRVKALQLVAVMELARRVIPRKTWSVTLIGQPRSSI